MREKFKIYLCNNNIVICIFIYIRARGGNNTDELCTISIYVHMKHVVLKLKCLVFIDFHQLFIAYLIHIYVLFTMVPRITSHFYLLFHRFTSDFLVITFFSQSKQIDVAIPFMRIVSPSYVHVYVEIYINAHKCLYEKRKILPLLRDDANTNEFSSLGRKLNECVFVDREKIFVI